jgi:hypothetical protein
MRERAYTCGLEAALDVIGGKWKVLILWHLHPDVRRFGELKRVVAGISEKMLIQQLRDGGGRDRTPAGVQRDPAAGGVLADRVRRVPPRGPGAPLRVGQQAHEADRCSQAHGLLTHRRGRRPLVIAGASDRRGLRGLNGRSWEVRHPSPLLGWLPANVAKAAVSRRPNQCALPATSPFRWRSRRRYRAGGTSNDRLNARLNAGSEPYPTSCATWRTL